MKWNKARECNSYSGYSIFPLSFFLDSTQSLFLSVAHIAYYTGPESCRYVYLNELEIDTALLLSKHLQPVVCNPASRLIRILTRRLYRWLSVLFLLSSFFLFNISLASAHQLAVWSILNGSLGSQLFFSEQHGNAWTSPVVIASSQSIITRPVVAGNDQNTIVIVWQEMETTSKGLWYRVKKGGKWTEPESLKLKTTSNVEPAMVTTANGNIWLFWSGVKGTDSEIYASPWKNGKWGQAERVSSNPAGPNKLPEPYLTVDGLLRVRWTGYDGTLFRQFEGWKNGNQWIQSVQFVTNTTMSHLLKEPGIALPVILPMRTQLCLFNFETGLATQFILRNSLPSG